MIWNDCLYFWTDSRVLANRNLFIFGVGLLREVRICLRVVRWDLSGPYLLGAVKVGNLSIIPVAMDGENGFGFLGKA